MTAVEKYISTVAALIWVAGRYELVIRVDSGLSVLGCVALLKADRRAGHAHR